MINKKEIIKSMRQDVKILSALKRKAGLTDKQEQDLSDIKHDLKIELKASR